VAVKGVGGMNEFLRPSIQRDYVLEAFIRGIYINTGPHCTLEEFFEYFAEFDKARTLQIEALQKLATDAINCQTPTYIFPAGWPDKP
jgi:hypothetical protein